MVFSSSIFIFIFLPIFLAIYYLTPFRWKSVTILVGSYAFYAWWRVDFLLLFIGVTAWNYLIGLAIDQQRENVSRCKWILGIGVAFNLATLGYFKYANFGVDSFNQLLGYMGEDHFSLPHVILPIGISFYIFQAISYIIDVYRRDTEPTRRFVDFAAFIALFPQLIAGPVLRYKDLADQFIDRTHTMDKFTEGVGRFMQGFVKKVFIADSIAPLADNAFALSDPTAADAWLGILAYTAQLYFDFSGYSDMAIGLGLMMGFRFVENFRQPYISHSITEFWRRWHISLSNWLRDYLYIPLGGNRHGTFNTYKNLFLTMLLGGLWHGANWTFIFWGAWHGTWLAIERYFGWGDKSYAFNYTRWIATLLIVMIGWVAFRALSISDAMTFYNAMFLDWNFNFSSAYAVTVTRYQLLMLVVAFAAIFIFGYIDKFRGSRTKASRSPAMMVNHTVSYCAMAFLFMVSLMKLTAESYSPFLYFQF
ncbi:Peptidoglycan O-acetyltransferase [Thalassocella blandensis]|nr:Peptidoglycan O-acetyltransferase [Thalassocella blandensis]